MEKNAKPLVYYLPLGRCFFVCLFVFKKIINKTSVCLKLTAGLLSYLIKRQGGKRKKTDRRRKFLRDKPNRICEGLSGQPIIL